MPVRKCHFVDRPGFVELSGIVEQNVQPTEPGSRQFECLIDGFNVGDVTHKRQGVGPPCNKPIQKRRSPCKRRNVPAGLKEALCRCPAYPGRGARYQDSLGHARRP